MPRVRARAEGSAAKGGMPISLEVLRRVEKIYSHASCPDGLASAMILQDAFRMLGMAPPIEFLHHNTPAHRNAGREGRSLFCDISPTPGVADAFHMTGDHVVLDHHIGTKELVQCFGPLGVYSDAPGVSGAVLAFEEVWEPAWSHAVRTQNQAWNDGSVSTDQSIQVMRFAAAVGVRDTWQTDDPRFRAGQEITRALMSKPAAYWLDALHVAWVAEPEMAAGRALLEAHEDAVRQAADQCVEVRPGFVVFQENSVGARLTSDVAEAYRQSYPHLNGLVAGFSFVVDAGDAPTVPNLGRDHDAIRLVVSLRSLGDFDVCALAKRHGGGGHTKAAGFSVPLAETRLSPYEYLSVLLNEPGVAP